MTTPNSPATLLILFWDLGLGGVQKKMTDISRYAETKEGKHLCVHIALRNKPIFRMDKNISFPAATFHYRPIILRDIIHIPFSLYCLWQIFRTRPDTVLAFLDHASCIAIVCGKILFWRHIRIVINEDTFTSGHTISWIKRKLISLLYPMADCIISPTEASKHDLVRAFGIPPSKIFIRPNWTLTQRRKKSEKPTYDMVYIGRFAKQKNIPYLIRVVRHIQKIKSDVNMCLVGDGPEKSAIQKSISDYRLEDHVKFVDSTHHISTHLQRAKIFVLSSLYEGMPIALLEAMTQGVPVVTTRYPGVSEYITNGKTGYIAESEHVFAAHILTLLSDTKKRKRIQQNAALQVRRMYMYSAFKNYLETVLHANT